MFMDSSIRHDPCCWPKGETVGNLQVRQLALVSTSSSQAHGQLFALRSLPWPERDARSQYATRKQATWFRSRSGVKSQAKKRTTGELGRATTRHAEPSAWKLAKISIRINNNDNNNNTE